MSDNFIIPFNEAENEKDLAQYLGIELSFLTEITNEDNKKSLYDEHRIPKRSDRDKFRIAYEAKDPYLKDVHKAFRRLFNLFISSKLKDFPHKSAYGYVKGRNIFENAKKHCGAYFLLRADIKDFFQSITSKNLVREFKKLDINEQVARTLANFVTIDRSLALGLPSSPMLANLICLSLDHKLEDLSSKYKCVYTRYADDISISGNSHIPEKKEILEILNEEGFMLSDKKFRITKMGQAHFVTGLSIQDQKNPHSPRFLKKRLRQEVFYCKKFGISDHSKRVKSDAQKIINRISGTIGYVEYIEHNNNISFIKETWRDVLSKEQKSISYKKNYSQFRTDCFYIDESKFKFKGKVYFCICTSRINENQVKEIEEIIKKIKKEYGKDPFSLGRKDKFEKKGYHASDTHPEFIQKYIRIMARFQFQSYIYYTILNSDKEYNDKYLSLINRALRQRMISSNSREIKIYIEKNQVNEHKIRKLLVSTYEELLRNDEKRPGKEPEINIIKKEDDDLIMIPDYMLHIFHRYARINENQSIPDNKTKRINFELLRDRYKLICDIDSNTYFSRKNPFYPFS